MGHNNMQEELSIQKIGDAVTEAFYSPNNSLVIKGYTSSSGSVTDYTVKHVGRIGYLQLVTDSLAALGSTWNPGEYDDDVWEQAKVELAVSWAKTLSGEHAVRVFKEKDETADPVVTLTHLKASVIYERSGSLKLSNQSAKTLAKQDILLQVPLGMYVGRLNLAPNKVVDVYSKPDQSLAEEDDKITTTD